MIIGTVLSLAESRDSVGGECFGGGALATMCDRRIPSALVEMPADRPLQYDPIQDVVRCGVEPAANRGTHQLGGGVEPEQRSPTQPSASASFTKSGIIRVCSVELFDPVFRSVNE